MELVLLLTGFIAGIVTVVSRPAQMTLPSDKAIMAWESSILSPDHLTKELNNKYCYETHRQFISCAAAVDKMTYH